MTCDVCDNTSKKRNVGRGRWIVLVLEEQLRTFLIANTWQRTNVCTKKCFSEILADIRFETCNNTNFGFQN